MKDADGAVVILGAGGHARMLAGFLSRGGYRVRGYVCPRPDAESMADWLGEDCDLPEILERGDRVVNGVGSVRRPTARQQAFDSADAAGAQFLDFVHPASLIDASARMGKGAQVLAGAILQPSCTVGRNVLINTAAVVEHDVQIGDHVHVAPRACLCGAAEIGHVVHVGAGAIVLQGVTVGDEAVIGACAVVTRPVPAGATVVGNPARILRPSGA